MTILIYLWGVLTEVSVNFPETFFDFSMDRREPEAEKYKGPGGVKSGQECVGNVCNRCRL